MTPDTNTDSIDDQLPNAEDVSVLIDWTSSQVWLVAPGQPALPFSPDEATDIADDLDDAFLEQDIPVATDLRNAATRVEAPDINTCGVMNDV